MARYSLALAALMATEAFGRQPVYEQCGGQGWTGPTSCVENAHCQYWSDWYHQCVPSTTTDNYTKSSAAAYFAKSTFVTMTRASPSTSAHLVHHYSTNSSKPSSVLSIKPHAYSAEAATTSARSSTSVVTSVSLPSAYIDSVPSFSVPIKSSSVVGTAVFTTKTSYSATSSSTSSSGKTQYAGVNIAGFDFGCDHQGSCKLSQVAGPITSKANGTAQIQHFVRDDKLNAFRLPVGWQFLVNNKLGNSLDSTNFAKYDELVQGCLATGSLCIIDIHNYARWDGGIVGHTGPTDDQFASVWTQLATKYASNKNVAFGLMNEPHDLTIEKWGQTTQRTVTAIRKAGATSQLILLPGTDYTAAGSFVSSGSGAALLKVTNPDGTTKGLVFDVHQYLDSDGSGTSSECVTDQVTNSWEPFAAWLRKNSRQAFVSEIGGGNTASCEKYVCSALDYLNKNADVYLGYTGWGAGSFSSSYEISLTPNGNTDTSLMTKCFSRA